MKQNYFQEFLHYTILNVLGMIGLSCYILADTFFVSKGLGVNGLAALNIAIPAYSFINGTGLMLGIGGATRFSIFSSRNQRTETRHIFTETILTGIVFSALFVILGLFFTAPIATLLGADAETFEMTITYIRILFLFAPAFILNNVLNNFVRNDGNPKIAMLAMLIGSLTNIVLDYVFIFPFKLGIFGAAIATGIAPIVGIAILSTHIFSKKSHLRFQPEMLRLKEIAFTLALGIPSLITEIASGVVMIVFNLLILRLEGNVGVAAYGIIANIALVIIAIYNGIGQGMQPLLSRFYGSSDKLGLKSILKYGALTELIVSFLLYIIIVRFAAPITSIFNSEQNILLQSIAEQGLKFYFLAIPFAGANIILATYFTSNEQALPAQIVSILRGLVLIIPTAFLMAKFAGTLGVWCSYPITEAIVTSLAIILLTKTHKLKAS